MTDWVEIGNCKLALGDCREILPELRDISVVSDPPYGIGFKYDGEYLDRGADDYVELVSATQPFPRCLLQYPEETMRYLVPAFGPPDEVFTWVYNSNTARQTRLFSFWGMDVDFSRAQQAAKNPNDKRVKELVASYDWTADFQQVKNVSNEKTGHPCQVPVGLMQRVIQFTNAEVICDPFSGSGTTGVACVKLGRRFIGIEIEERYFDIACRRIEEATKQGDLFFERGNSEATPMLFN